jgi:hypothetical protein
MTPDSRARSPRDISALPSCFPKVEAPQPCPPKDPTLTPNSDLWGCALPSSTWFPSPPVGDLTDPVTFQTCKAQPRRAEAPAPAAMD